MNSPTALEVSTLRPPDARSAGARLPDLCRNGVVSYTLGMVQRQDPVRPRLRPSAPIKHLGLHPVRVAGAPPATWCSLAAREEVRARRDGGGRCAAAVAVCLAVALFGACSFDYDAADIGPEELPVHLPETELTDVTRTIVRDGRVVAEIRARRVSNYRRPTRTLLDDVQYTEYDAAGTPVTSGSAEHAVYHGAREDVELAGAIRLRSESHRVILHAKTLRWEDERRRLVTGPNAPVRLTRDDGSQVEGTGLQVDVRRRTIRFTGRVTGTLVVDSDEE